MGAIQNFVFCLFKKVWVCRGQKHKNRPKTLN
jgi:hypothetical protein